MTEEIDKAHEELAEAEKKYKQYLGMIQKKYGYYRWLSHDLRATAQLVGIPPEEQRIYWELKKSYEDALSRARELVSQSKRK